MFMYWTAEGALTWDGGGGGPAEEAAGACGVNTEGP